MNELDETPEDEIQEHGHYPSVAEEAAENEGLHVAGANRAQRSPAEIDQKLSREHEGRRKAADARSNFPGEGIKEHGLNITSRLTGKVVDVGFGPQGGGLVPKNPFASLAQEGYLHAHPEKLGKTALAEWDASTKARGTKMPQHVKKSK